MVDLNSQVTQSQFGQLVGMSQQAVSELFRRQILRDGAPTGEWLKAYCEHLREMAAGRGGGSGADLVAERARLAREQADRIAMQNAQRREELATRHVLEAVLVLVGARVSHVLGTIPEMLRTQLPLLSSDDLAAVKTIVTKACNMASSMRLRDIEQPADEADTGTGPTAEEPAAGDIPLNPAGAGRQHLGPGGVDPVMD